MGGILTALANSKYEYCFITACDTPFISLKIIQPLLENCGSADAVVPVWNGNTEPLVSIYNKRIMNLLENDILEGKLKLWQFLKTIETKYINLSELFDNSTLQQSFTNINTPDELDMPNVRKAGS